MSRGAALLLFFGTCCAVVYLLHIPLPSKLAGRRDHHKIQIAEFVLRITYLYPVELLRSIGAEWQLLWARVTLHSLTYICNPWTNQDKDMKISDTTFDGVKVRVYEPKRRFNDGALIFVHGGGFVLFSINSFESPIREIVRRSRVLTISIDYRLAPEHAFPAGLNDCMAAVKHFLKTGAAKYGVDPSKVVLMGDSAGGNLVAVISNKLNQSPEPLPKIKAQVLVYPLLQFIDFQTPSYQMYHKSYKGSALLDPGSIARYMLIYTNLDPALEYNLIGNDHVSTEVLEASDRFHHHHFPEHFIHDEYEPVWVHSRNISHEVMAHSDYSRLQNTLVDPELSPLMERSFAGLPSTFIATGEYDILRDEGFLYAQHLMQAGVDVTYNHYDVGFHGMMNFHQDIEVGATLVADISHYVRSRVVG